MTSTSSGTTLPQPPVIRRSRSPRTGLYVGVAVVIVIIAIVGVSWQVGLFGDGKSGTGSSGCNPPASTSIKGAGSTFVYPLMYQWETTYTQGAVNYASVGSGAGILQITAKTVDFGATDAPLNATQRAAAPGLLTIPESAGGVVPIYNLPGVSTALRFNGSVLAQIYLGTITNWNSSALQAINPGVVLPNANIIVVHRSDGSGTTFIWTSYLSAESATWKSQVGHATSVVWPTGVASKGNAGVTTTVQTTADAIGYVDINYALTNAIAYGKVQNPAGNYILATLNNTASALKDANPTLPPGSGDWYNVSVLNAPGAGDYPIVSFTYVLIYPDLSAAFPSYTLANAENLVDFLDWAITAGQSYSAQLYYIPLPTSVVAADTATLQSVTFGGSAVPTCVA